MARSRGARPQGFVVGGRRPVLEAIRSGRARSVIVAQGTGETQGLRELLAEADRAGIRVRRAPRREIDELGANDHQGVAALISPPKELDEKEMLAFEFPQDAVVVVLDGITDPQNMGASARAAEAAGAAMLVARRRRAAPISSAAIRASAGALLHLPLARVPNLPRALRLLKERGFFVAGMDQSATLDIEAAPPPPRPLALVVGAEGEGISRLVRESCDQLVAIPMRGRMGSLNAASAAAVGLFGYVLRSPA